MFTTNNVGDTPETGTPEPATSTIKPSPLSTKEIDNNMGVTVTVSNNSTADNLLRTRPTSVENPTEKDPTAIPNLEVWKKQMDDMTVAMERQRKEIAILQTHLTEQDRMPLPSTPKPPPSSARNQPSFYVNRRRQEISPPVNTVYQTLMRVIYAL